MSSFKILNSVVKTPSMLAMPGHNLPILFNDLIRFRSKGGIASYAEGVASHLPVHLFSSTLLGKTLGIVSKQKDAIALTKSSGSHGKLKSVLEAYLTFCSFRLFHEPDLIVTQNKIPNVVTAHDLSVLLTPQYHPTYRVKKYEENLKQSVENTLHFICNSKDTQRNLIQHLSIPESKTTIIPMAVSPKFRKFSNEEYLKFKLHHALPDNYFLFIGTLEPRKNLAFLLKVYDLLDTQLKAAFPLILIGSWGWEHESIQKAFSNLSTPQYVKHFEGLTTDEVCGYLNGATALLFPSLAEGFGIPILEAFQCETPVICSNIDVFHEVAQEAAVYCHGELEWRHALIEITKRKPKNLIERGNYVKRLYSWEKSAALTIELYQKLLKSI